MRPCTDMGRVLADLEAQARSGSPNYVPRDLQLEAVGKFWDNCEFESLRQARLVSFGLAVHPWNDQRCLMEDPERFGATLAGLSEWEAQPRQFRICYQGLVCSYFDYDGLGRNVSATGQRNWQQLQGYLSDKVKLIKDSATAINPDWVGCALANQGIFSATPCATYAQDLLDGRDDEVRQIRELLGITDASWFTRELVLSQIVRACALEDTAFSNMIDWLLQLLGNNEVLRDRGLQLLLDRYAQMSSPPQHSGLKDYSVNAWGNPWLPSNEYRWGGVTEEAREMVSIWLKSEFVKLFFSKLAQDGQSDTRRLEFWIKYVPVMDSIHFALGKYAKSSRHPDFVQLRNKLKGLTSFLEDSNPHNNAFIMTMGNLVAVEFSGESNAFYGYNRQYNLPFDLSRPVRSSPVNGKNSLKNDVRALYLIHQDNVHGYANWEDRFKMELQDKFGLLPGRRIARSLERNPALTSSTPQARPVAPSRHSASSQTLSPAQQISLSIPTSENYSEEGLRKLALCFNATVVDKRYKGGALWLQMGDLPEVRNTLKKWGFRYSEHKGGWWKSSR